MNDEEACAHKPIWRASLEDPRTGRRQGFACLEALFDFLAAKIDLEADSDPHQSQSGEVKSP